MTSDLITEMNQILQELENQALQKYTGQEGLQVCLKLRNLKQTAFKAGINWEKEHSNPISGIAAIQG